MENLFSLDFGAKPSIYIQRTEDANKIIDTFTSKQPSTHNYVIIGARGSGKTVLMTDVSHILRENLNWIHIDLHNNDENLMQHFLADFKRKMKKSISIENVEVSVLGSGISVQRELDEFSFYSELDALFEKAKKKGLRILLTLDEVANTKEIRAFTTYFQHCIREEYPVFLIMTGLYKNIRALQNNKTHTFLKRIPRIELGPLNLSKVAQKYLDAFNLPLEEVRILADYTKGYSYAFQILGHLLVESEGLKVTETLLSKFKLLLEECSYDKIWEEMSLNEKRIVSEIAKREDSPQNLEIRNALEMDKNTFSTYKDILVKSGILNGNECYGHLQFALPMFEEFVRTKI